MLKYNDPLLVEKLTDIAINHETFKDFDYPFTYHLLLGEESFDPAKLVNDLKRNLSLDYSEVLISHKITPNKTGYVCTILVSLGKTAVNLPHDQVRLLKSDAYDVLKDILETRKTNKSSEVFEYNFKNYGKNHEFIFTKLICSVLRIEYPLISVSFTKPSTELAEVGVRVNLGIIESRKAQTVQ